MADPGLNASMVTDGIANLVAKSLVALDRNQGVMRWHLLETVRAYALEKLAEHNKAKAVAERHAVYFRDLLAPLAPGRGTSLSDEDLTRCVREIANVRSALDWSFSPLGDTAIGIDLTVAYAWMWLDLALMAECRDRCEQALRGFEPDAGTNTQPYMQLQIALGRALLATMGSVKQAKSCSEPRARSRQYPG